VKELNEFFNALPIWLPTVIIVLCACLARYVITFMTGIDTVIDELRGIRKELEKAREARDEG